MNFRRQRTESVDINLTPLIDVVFLLLIFFMVSTTFTKETHLDVDLPTSSSTLQSIDKNQVEIVINATGGFMINGHALVKSDFDTIKQALGKEVEGLDNPPVIIVADAQTPHQSVIYAMDAAGQLGLVKIRMATKIDKNDQN
ncbi:ExbD/TolR family protein [Gynuella sunshinyii]|uniref:Biopolymer transport protein n=1 Tax=Gynuella sunshinyii YC6258 TaxID=1445510 RepID=A0A0C5VZI9_9GAMM|nr:biopolymer transporter ExbD [Gynuella sunshinyii]AJQ95834.1 biopolymer transport protein [Gynuella sunshinyii YC6258]